MNFQSSFLISPLGYNSNLLLKFQESDLSTIGSALMSQSEDNHIIIFLKMNKLFLLNVGKKEFRIFEVNGLRTDGITIEFISIL